MQAYSWKSGTSLFLWGFNGVLKAFKLRGNMIYMLKLKIDYRGN